MPIDTLVAVVRARASRDIEPQNAPAFWFSMSFMEKGAHICAPVLPQSSITGFTPPDPSPPIPPSPGCPLSSGRLRLGSTSSKTLTRASHYVALARRCCISFFVTLLPTSPFRPSRRLRKAPKRPTSDVPHFIHAVGSATGCSSLSGPPPPPPSSPSPSPPVSFKPTSKCNAPP
ncbi:hypothetical protein GLOTRDRAFT_134356 [Gloeophyllum trabeum ATCC 11539]|uniref:Uncharacterized protein n=1 Tax=Gloeophyllum trabeum (strain ATCC 11539 / FP-39264 / Madison 617) TaxID=670483 RepID=S7PRL4_GLOTA|nr:uncharacterized protein GLOTRDRAFT_134356 [Gloeophyllum trabeum ATCC 11539]EPQ50002.1 hypothetical protein GLOTRDRAFT_134356 [Gloeophyllum trabeum ATCC 11539]